MATLTDLPRISVGERLLHQMAFAGIEAQKSLADIEDRIYERRLRQISIEKPVFVTSLPRAGTTLLLQCIAPLPDFATSTYRNMPFVLCPLFWDILSKGLRKAAKPVERAHHDGMLVSADSPEAFEEVIWLSHWPSKYHKTTIDLWSVDDRDAEFERFFHLHMRKLILLAATRKQSVRRYISKNNANIARISLLRRLFPDAVMLVPFREPLAHASSLLRQHQNFLRIHGSDQFALQYMKAMGHLEFGKLVRRIEFTADAHLTGGPTTLAYWLAYWSDAFAHLLEHHVGDVRLVSYEALCAQPSKAAAHLASALQVSDARQLAEQFSVVRSPTSYPTNAVSAGLMERATEIYTKLSAHAVV